MKHSYKTCNHYLAQIKRFLKSATKTTMLISGGGEPMLDLHPKVFAIIIKSFTSKQIGWHKQLFKLVCEYDLFRSFFTLIRRHSTLSRDFYLFSRYFSLSCLRKEQQLKFEARFGNSSY